MERFHRYLSLVESIYFSMLIMLGYICGITHKLLYSRDVVIWLYIINMAFLLTDMILWYRYRNNPAPVTVQVEDETVINEEVEV